MSALGDYVYLKHENYFEKNKKSVGKKIHYEMGIFNKHKERILKQIKTVKVKNLEKEYNEILKNTYQTWQNIVENASEVDRLDFFKTILANNNLIKKTIDVDEIIQHLQFDAERNTIVYTPPKEAGLNTGIKIKKLRGETYSFLDTLLRKRAIPQRDELEAFLKQENLTSVERQECENLKEISNNLIEELTQLENYYLQQSNTIGKLELLNEVDTSKIYRAGSTVRVPSDIANHILQIIEKITYSTDILQMNKKIQAGFSETIGQVIATQLSYNIKDCFNSIEDIISSIGKSIGTQQMSNAPIVSSFNTKVQMNLNGIDFKELNTVLSKNFAKQIKVDGSDLKGLLTVSHNVVSQKADIVLDVTDSGQNIGASFKNTDLAQITRYDQIAKQNVLTDIELQESKLKVLLMGMQKEQNDFGNHYLNILATKDNNLSAKYKNIKQLALESLSLYILYSSFTGRGQGRIAAGDNTAKSNFADILVVYDKNIKNGLRAKFFSIKDIVEDIVQKNALLNSSVVNITPQLQNLYLINDKIFPNAGPKEMKTAIRTRLASILAQTEFVKIRCGITKQYLQNFYNKNLTS